MSNAYTTDGGAFLEASTGSASANILGAKVTASLSARTGIGRNESDALEVTVLGTGFKAAVLGLGVECCGGHV